MELLVFIILGFIIGATLTAVGPSVSPLFAIITIYLIYKLNNRG